MKLTISTPTGVVYWGQRRPDTEPQELPDGDLHPAEWQRATGTRVTVRVGLGKPTHLAPRLHMANHSPTGFEWGYDGSGPSQLALALLVDLLERCADLDTNAVHSIALANYMALRAQVLARITGPSWEISADELVRWLEASTHTGRLDIADTFAVLRLQAVSS